MTNTQYTDLKSTALPYSEYEISASIPADVMATYRSKAIKALGENVTVPGFRKGHVPEDMLIGHIGESRVMERAANLALADIYPHMIAELDIKAIGSPLINITKLAAGNPLEFSARTAVLPDVTLPDYADIAKKAFGKEDTIEVTDAEVEETLNHVRRQRAQIDAYEQQKKDGVEKPELPEIGDDDLPELTDEFVKTLGDFESVEAFTTKVRENITEEKKLKAREKKRIETIEAIIEKTKVDMPVMLVDQEIDRIRMQLEADVAQTGTTLEDYLKNVDKDIEALKKEWRPEAEKRAKLQLIVNTIAQEHDIAPSDEEVEREVGHIASHYPDAPEENVRAYVRTTKRNELVFQHLETLGTQ